MAWDAGTITSATPWAALSQKVKDLISGGSGIANWSFVKNIPAGTGAGQSGSASYSVDLFRCRGAANLYKRAKQENLANVASTSDGTSFVHTVTTPSASRFIVVFVYNTKTTGTPDDPATVTLNGVNAPTFTKIKSQAGAIGGTGDVKGTLWIGKSSGSAPTGTQLTVDFGGGNTQTGCGIIMDQWDGMDLTLGADGVDGTGATKIGIAVNGNNGTSSTTHQTTFATMLGAQSLQVAYAVCAGGSTYTTKTGWASLAASASYATPTVNARGEWRPNTNNLDIDTTPQLVNSGTITSWASIGFEFQRTTDATSVTNANDAGKDWYFMIEIPVTDGAVNSSMTCAEDYDGNELFRRCNSTIASLTPDPFDFSGGTVTPTLNVYNTAAVNRAQTTFATLNTSGFNYYLKITPNLIIISARIGATETTRGAMLLDSFVTNAVDMPLMFLNGLSSASAQSSFTRLPGVSGSISSGNGFGATLYAWTSACRDAFTTNASNSQDLWASGKVHAARLFVCHVAGRLVGNSGANNWGYARGVVKQDILCIATGGTVLLGDTMTIAGNTWTVIGSPLFYGYTGSQSVFLVTRAN